MNFISDVYALKNMSFFCQEIVIFGGIVASQLDIIHHIRYHKVLFRIQERSLLISEWHIFCKFACRSLTEWGRDGFDSRDDGNVSMPVFVYFDVTEIRNAKKWQRLQLSAGCIMHDIMRWQSGGKPCRMVFRVGAS